MLFRPEILKISISSFDLPGQIFLLQLVYITAKEEMYGTKVVVNMHSSRVRKILKNSYTC
jgi:hypothetical protein